jgi:hypothetical protein
MSKIRIMMGLSIILAITSADASRAGTFAGTVFDLSQPPVARQNRDIRIAVVGTRQNGTTFDLPSGAVAANGTYTITVDNADVRAVSLTFSGTGLDTTRLERLLNTQGQTVRIDISMPDAQGTNGRNKCCIFGCLFSR